ncbi:flavin reductase family protein [Kineosporia succinea]|uniref:Flavin reductase (DIM6/NTAB) family NADH-FMN oxidoreductase RutF n=1 Tax=Kineosporia succinea TaxID=84632 RepID=A0ABT9PAS1_9ACTN|nr:flavin reductase family protein [Kineosporia succinea]MDP9829791.1 flavin reductase (DIM6/NTAB) family NADH-FMN oxidoreductase RutF [Kineosporia succinea]
MTLAAHNRDTSLIRKAFARYPSGVVALAARGDAGPVAMVASSFAVGVSLDPPLVLFSARNESRTWPLLRRSPRIGISLLGADQAGLCRRLAGADAETRFQDDVLTLTEDGAVLFSGASLWLDCSVYGEMPAGDHRVVLLEVHTLWHDEAAEDPLVFHGSAFRRLQRTA